MADGAVLEGVRVINPFGSDHALSAGAVRLLGFSTERRGRADWAAFDRLMARGGGEPPRPGTNCRKNRPGALPLDPTKGVAFGNRYFRIGFRGKTPAG